MPTVNLSFDPAAGYQDLLQSAPKTGTVTATNNGAFHVYINDMSQPGHPVEIAKIQAGTTKTFDVVKNRAYSIQVCGDVSITYTIN